MQSLEHTKLRDTPFRMGVTPSEIVAHTSWCEARDRTLAALAEGAPRVALIGHTGSGRTLLLNTLASMLGERGRAVRLVDGARLPADLGGDAVLLVDDADRLDRDAVARCARRRAPCIFAGPPVLRVMIPPPFATVGLKPLSPDEVARFVAVRLAAAGRRRDYMQPDAVLALARLSGGVPRQVNVLGGSAVFLAELDGAADVSQRHVEEAASMRDGGDPLPPTVDEDVYDAPPASRLASAAPRTAMASTRPPARRASFASRLALTATGIAAALLIAATISSHPWTKIAQRQTAALAPVASPPAATPQPREAAPVPEVPAPPAAQQPAAPAAQPAPAQLPAPAPAPQPVAPVTPALAPAPSAAPAASSPPPAASEQIATPPRVVLHYRTGDEREADHLATWLAQLDPRFGRIETHQVPSTPRTPSIRFYYPEDVGAAWALKAALSNTGETWQVSNYTRRQQRPRRGTLEVWLP